MQLLGEGLEQDIKQRTSVQHEYNQLRSKGMYQVYLGPQFSDKLLDQDPNRLEEHHKTLDRCDTAIEGRDMPELGQPA